MLYHVSLLKLQIIQTGFDCVSSQSINIKFVLHITFFFIMFPEIEGVASDSVNEKVIQDKKRKLQETLDRVLSLYVSKSNSIGFKNT